MTCHVACCVNIDPSKFDKSPSNHSVRKNMLSPNVDFNLWFLYICGSCANSHDMILHVPSTVDNKARLVGTQVWKVADTLYRNALAGSQCAGNVGLAMSR